MSSTTVCEMGSVCRSGHRHPRCRGLSRGSSRWTRGCLGLIRVFTSSNGAGCHGKDTDGVVCIGKQRSRLMTPVCAPLEYESHLQSLFSLWTARSVCLDLTIGDSHLRHFTRKAQPTSRGPFPRGKLSASSRGDAGEVSWGGTDVQIIGVFGSRNYGYQMFLSYLDKTLIFHSRSKEKLACVAERSVSQIPWRLRALRPFLPFKQTSIQLSASHLLYL